MKRRAFLKNLGLVASLPAMLGYGCTSVSAKTSRDPSRLRILTCNIRVDVPADSETGDGWVHRRDLCAEVIKAQGADLIGFQEMQNPHFEFLKDRLPEFHTYALYSGGKAPAPSNGIFFLKDRFELISAGGFYLSETPHIAGSKSWDSANPRLANWVHLKERKRGKELRFWNTHLDHISQPAREKGAAMILASSKVILHKSPQFLTGDLNSGATNPVITMIKDSGWLDTYAAVHGPEDPGFTAHAFKGLSAPTARSDGTPKEKIDWIFCRGPVTPLDSRILRDSRNGHYPSDHFFVSADLKF